jgi:hypothetical protein
VECLICKEPNPEGKRYCGNCGAALDISSEKFRQQVLAVMGDPSKQEDVLSVRIADKAEDRLWRYSKVLGGALAIFLGGLVFFGINSYENLKSGLNSVAVAANGKLEETASQNQTKLDQKGAALLNQLQQEAQPTQAALDALAERARVMDAALKKYELVAAARGESLDRLKTIRDKSPTTPIGDISSGLFTPVSDINSSLFAYGVATPVSVYKEGSTGSGVMRIQQRLARLGCYSGPINGTYDSATKDAVIAFQSPHLQAFYDNQIYATDTVPQFNEIPMSSAEQSGEVGTTTWNSLFSLVPPRCK